MKRIIIALAALLAPLGALAAPTQINLNTQVQGVLPVAKGGTASTTSTGSGAVVLATSPTIGTPTINTPAISGGTINNATVGATTPNTGSFTTLAATGLVTTAASTTSSAGIRLPHGAAPTTPTNGDLWSTTTGLFARINGATVGPYGSGGGSPGGSTTQLQYNNAGAFAGASGITTTGTELAIAPAANAVPLTVSGYSLTGANGQSLLDMSGTWNTTGTPTLIKANVTNTASNGSALLMDLQKGGVSQFNVRASDGALTFSGGIAGANNTIFQGGGYLNLYGGNGLTLGQGGNNAIVLSGGTTGTFDFASGLKLTWNGADTVIRRVAAATLALGAADAAAPAAQTLSVQGVAAGTTNTAGVNWTLKGSQGTGTGNGGDIVQQVALPGSTGSAQNALVSAVGLSGTTGAFGYVTGIGGAVTQATSRTTGVTLNKPAGAITLFSTTTTAGQTTTFTLTDSSISANDTVNCTQKSGVGLYWCAATAISAGSANLSIYTPAAVGSAEAPVFNVTITRGAAS